MRRNLIALAFGGLLFAGACALQEQDDRTSNWTSYGLNSKEQRYSPLSEINLSTVDRLGLAWSLDLPQNARLLEGTPLAIDGVLYFTAALAVTYAVDAVTGKELWRYDPEVSTHNARAMRVLPGGPNRGLAYKDGVLFLGASDGRLIALQATTGKVKWIVNTVDEPDSRKQISGAPRVFGNKVIIGHGGADFGTRGYVTAYDTSTGKQAWRFHTVPGDPAKGFEDGAQAMAAKTWSGDWWRWGGGGTAWNAITFDHELNRIYIGTGNGAYNPESHKRGSGDKLFLASIVALEANTGRYVWHYQVNPREVWDFKATADIVLADLKVGGRKRKVLMQAPTNGFFYVIDRMTGKLISAEKLGKVTWAERIDLKTGRPVEAPNIRFEKGPVKFWPSGFGVHNWQAMSFSPKTGLVYVPTMQFGGYFESTPQDIADGAAIPIGSRRFSFSIGASIGGFKQDPDDGTGSLIAWDPVTQKKRWSVKYKDIWNGGTLVTNGDLVFQGGADGWLRAFGAADGKEVWKFYASNGIIAPPITYAFKGQQYLTVLVGYGGAATAGGSYADPGWRYGKHIPRVLTFKLDADGKLPPTPGPDFSVKPINDPKLPIDEAAAQRGGRLWTSFSCHSCHGVAAASAGSVAPDLRASTAAHDLNTLHTILREGVLAPNGMPQFDDLTDREIQDLHMYIRKMSRFPAKRTNAAGG